MDIDAARGKLADDRVVERARELSEEVGGALFRHTCAVESVEDCANHLEGDDEARALLRDVHRDAAAALAAIERSLRRYSNAMGRLQALAPLPQPSDAVGIAVVDALLAHNGRAATADVLASASALLADAGRALWPGEVLRGLDDLRRDGAVAIAAGLCRLTDAGWSGAESRLGSAGAQG